MRIDRKLCPSCSEKHTIFEVVGDDFPVAEVYTRSPRSLMLRCPKSGERIYYRGKAPHWQWRLQ